MCAAFHGIGVHVATPNGIDQLVVPQPYVLQRHSPARWVSPRRSTGRSTNPVLDADSGSSPHRAHRQEGLLAKDIRSRFGGNNL